MKKDCSFDLNVEYENILNQLISENEGKIKSFINGEIIDYRKDDFKFFEFDEGLYVTIKKVAGGDLLRRGTVVFNLGFPFPVCSITRDQENLSDLEIDFYFKGEFLRSKQRLLLAKKFEKNINDFRWHELEDRCDFRQEFDRLMKNVSKERLFYVDPYSFIGDSFIGMHFADSFIEGYRFSNVIIFSRSHSNLGILGEAYPYEEKQIRSFFKQYNCLVFPDLLDINFQTTLSLISSLSGLKGLLIFPGRSLFVSLDGQKITFYHLNQADTILRDQNIEEYMNECLFPFVGRHQAFQHQPFRGDTRTFFINPFGSLSNKTINLEFVINVCRELGKIKGVSINLISGLRGCDFQKSWVKSFVKSGIMEEVDCHLLSYSTIDQLILGLYKLRPGAILTADTSIAHISNRLNIPNIVFCHAARFDNSSIQSMISESPVGFGRYFRNNFPLLIRDYKNNTPKFMGDFLRFISNDLNPEVMSQEDFNKFLENLIDFFPESYFYENVPEKYHENIKKILHDVSPINKILNLWTK